jgi:hypothetical protein
MSLKERYLKRTNWSFNLPDLVVHHERPGNPAPTMPTRERRLIQTRSESASSPDKAKTISGKLTAVSDAWDDFKESRSRQAIYGYLRSVYRLVMEYRRKRRTERLARRAYKYLGLFYPGNIEVFAAVIRGTSGGEVDPKTISKWSRALQYVALDKKRRLPLKEFMVAKGGVNACASNYARLRRSNAPRRRRPI